MELDKSVTSVEFCLLINPKRTLNISFSTSENTSLNFILSGLALFFNVNPMLYQNKINLLSRVEMHTYTF